MNLETATDAQRAAIATESLSVLAIAGPGAGKTATTVARIKRLIADGLEEETIAVLTFTNAGANEINERIHGIAEHTDLGFIGTLHSFALRMLKDHGGPWGYGDRLALVSPESAQDLLASKAKALGCKAPMKELLELKAASLPSRAGADGRRFNLRETVVLAFLEDMSNAGIVDYDILLREFNRLLDEEPFTYEISKRFSHLFVDEVQDSAPLDWMIYRSLPMRAKFFVGDPDQAIFGFRGGRVAEMVSFSEYAGEVITLEDNFRSRSEICDAAQRLIQHNRSRVQKRTISVAGAGGTVVRLLEAQNEGEEVALVANVIRAGSRPNREHVWDSIAILARTNAIADTFRRGLPPLGIVVVEETRTELPKDWTFSRALVELLVSPDNDALAFFFTIAREEKFGRAPALARVAAHQIRKEAAVRGVSINAFTLDLRPMRKPESVLEALQLHGCSRQARAIVAERFRTLPPGSSSLDLALSLADVREYVSRDPEAKGVEVLTIHAAKGREFDAVFVVGFEDECIPGRAAHAGDQEIEEERRLAYVAITRARRDLYLSHSRTRSSKYAGITGRTESRFLAEILPVNNSASIL